MIKGLISEKVVICLFVFFVKFYSIYMSYKKFRAIRIKIKMFWALLREKPKLQGVFFNLQFQGLDTNVACQSWVHIPKISAERVQLLSCVQNQNFGVTSSRDLIKSTDQSLVSPALSLQSNQVDQFWDPGRKFPPDFIFYFLSQPLKKMRRSGAEIHQRGWKLKGGGDFLKRCQIER